MVGKVAIVRYIARSAPASKLGGDGVLSTVQVNSPPPSLSSNPTADVSVQGIAVYRTKRRMQKYIQHQDDCIISGSRPNHVAFDLLNGLVLLT